MLTDARGCPTSAPSSVSLQQFEQALELSLSYQLDPLATIQKAIDADPAFAMGHALRAGLAVMATDRGAVPMLQESVEAIKAPNVQSLLDLVAEQDTRIRQLEIWCGLRFADPHELDDVGMQKSHVREQYEAFDFHNPRP